MEGEIGSGFGGIEGNAMGNDMLDNQLNEENEMVNVVNTSLEEFQMAQEAGQNEFVEA